LYKQIHWLSSWNRDLTWHRGSIKTLELTAGPRAATGLVHLDSETGEIVVANKIDHEQFPFINFTVRATDSGVPPRSSLADVFIQVLDENDNNPYFVGDVNNITVREDAPVGECVGYYQIHNVFHT
jgi:hypothetical protein